MTDRDYRLKIVLRAASIACLFMAMFVAVSGAAPTHAAPIRDSDNPALRPSAPMKSISAAGPSTDAVDVARDRRSSTPR